MPEPARPGTPATRLTAALVALCLTGAAACTTTEPSPDPAPGVSSFSATPVESDRLAWTARVRPVSAPLVVDGVPIVYHDNGGKLELAALNPDDGGVAWSHPAATSYVTPGVRIHAYGRDGSAVSFVMDGKLTGDPDETPWVRAQVIDLKTGQIRTSPQRAAFLRFPSACDDDRTGHACAPGVLEKGTPARTLDINLNTGIISAADPDLGDSEPVGPQLRRTTGSTIERWDKGKRVWRVNLADVLGTQWSTDQGWNFHDHPRANLIVGSVGRTLKKGEKTTFPQAITFALRRSTGKLLWKRADASLLPGRVSDVTPQPTLVLTGKGSVGWNGAQFTLTAVASTSVELLDPATGKPEWRLDSGPLDDGPVAGWPQLAPDDGRTSFQLSVKDRRLGVLLGDGSASPMPPGQAVWAPHDGQYPIPAVAGLGVGEAALTSRPVGGVHELRTAGGSPTDELPADTPALLGAKVDDLVLISTDRGVLAIR